MITDYFDLAIKNLKRRKLRSLLTIIGIFISVATIFILISLSLGLQDAVEAQFESLGGDKFFIQPKGQFGPPQAGASVQLTIDDVNAVRKINGVKRVSYMVAGNAKIEFKDEQRFFPVYGIPAEDMDFYADVGSFKIEEGTNLRNGDRKKIVIGNHYKTRNIFSTNVQAGDKFFINGEEFKVQGIFGLIGNPDDDRNILLPAEDIKALFNTGDRVDFIIVQVESGEDVKEVAENVERRLRKFRDVDEKTQDFTIITPEEILEIFGSVLSIITAFLGGVAAISLIVGAIGITNTMYTSVLERTKEIGIMKAVGARNEDILTIFVIESGLLGLIGGIVGVIIGFAIAKLIEFIAVQGLGTTLLQAASPWYLFLGCFAFAFLTGVVSGALPAWRASKIIAVNALRYE